MWKHTREIEEPLPDTERDLQRIVEEAERISHPPGVPVPALDALAGMATGALVGALAGPPGLVAGMIIGAAAGAAAGVASHDDGVRRRRHDAELDADIGIDGGRIGEAMPDLPAPVVGVFSRPAMGAGGREAPPSEGAVQSVD